MKLFERLTDIFRRDEFVPSSAVFPEIDRVRIARDLNLEEEGRKRGNSNLPGSDDQSMDQIELNAIGRVEELRRRGLENFETNRRVYAERLSLAVSARMMVETEANNAKSRFVQEVTLWTATMVTPRKQVQETYHWLMRFREINKLERPAKKASNWPSILGLPLLLIVIESLGNSYLFSQSNPLGLLGGWIAAFLIALGNVSLSTLLGMGSRYINCRGVMNTLKKLFGLLFGLFWLAFVCVYNMAVAHFRDAVESGGDWREAGFLAIQALKVDPIGLETFESYVLLVLGVFMSIVAFLKGYNSFDPYPAYSHVSKDVTDARVDYVAHLEASINSLAKHRDEAVESLRAANDEVHRNITDSVDALYGHKALTSGVAPFLEQCELAAQYVLAVYRDANKAARSDAPPQYFSKTFTFTSFEPTAVDEDRKSKAEEQVEEVSTMVGDAIEEIFEVFDNAVSAHYEIDELEGTFIERHPTIVAKMNARRATADGKT